MRFLRQTLPSLIFAGLLSNTYGQQLQLAENQQIISFLGRESSFGSGVSMPETEIHYLNAESMEVPAISHDELEPNTPPVASDDAASGNEDTSISVNVTTNDNDSDGTIDVATVDLDPTTSVIDNTLTVANGSFSVDNTGLVTFVPNQDFNGIVTINYTVNDDAGDPSNQAAVSITVNAVNDPPVITGQTAPTINATEDIQFTIHASDLVISDPDVGDVFSVTVLPGTNYTPSGADVIPTPNYNGPLTVNIMVNDGTVDSAPFGISVSVDAVDDPPVIMSQVSPPLLATEDTQFTVPVSSLVINDPDNSTFTVLVKSGTNYSFSGTTITPAADYNGALTVNVTVSDGTLESAPFGVAVSLTAVNDAPVIASQVSPPLLATEDTPFTIPLTSLVITDPDNSAFTLTVQPGTNYSVSGGTITPALNYNGTLTVNVTVSDGSLSSAPFGVSVSLAAVNDPPSISGQNSAPLLGTEDTPFTIPLTSLIINDPDNSTFTLTVLPGTNYSFSGGTITPASNYSGALIVNVTVSDGSLNSASFGVSVSLAGVNDPPSITGQNSPPLLATEDTPFTIPLSSLIISDPDNSTFTITVSAGTNYTFSGTTITPASNYNGALTVNVTVSDGSLNSASFGVSVSVTAVNDAPTITGQNSAPLSATEDTPFTIPLSSLIITDPDNSTFTVVVQPGTNYSFSGTTITPAANYNGALTVNVKVSDGAALSSAFAVAVNVAAVNDPPIITGQTPAVLSKTEDVPFTIASSDLIISDPDVGDVFTVTILSGTNYTVSGTTITPTLNYNGPLTVNVKVSDGTVSTASFGVSVNLAAVNDPPTITGQTPSVLNKTEDVAFTITPFDLVISDPDNSGFTVKILSGTNYTFSGATVTPSANYNGALTVNVAVNDGTVDSAPFAVSVNLAAVNDAPQITGQTISSIGENQSIALLVTHFLITDPDNVYPTDFSLSVLGGSNYSISGNVVTPATNFVGTLQIKVIVNDGPASSPIYTMSLLVSANTPPSITGQASVSTPEETAITIQLSNLTVTDPDNTYPTGFTLNVSIGSNYTVSGNTVTPAIDFNGTLTVPVTVNDGTSNSPLFNFKIQVTPVNDAPKITGQATLSTNEDTPIPITLANLTVTDPDNSYPTGFSLIISSGSNYTFSGNTITPAANYFGTLSVGVQVNDGQASSTLFGLQIQVNPVNDPPVITGQATLTTNEDTPLTIQFSNLTVTDPDNTYPTGFTMSLTAGSNYTTVGRTVTPALNYNGPLTIPVTVNDGSAISNSFNLSITVTPVNDAPTSNGISPVTVLEDDTADKVASIVNGFTDVEDAAPLLTYTIMSNDHPEYFQAAVSINQVKGELNFKLKPNVFGTAKITIKATDTGGLSVQDVLTINVTSVNDPPSFDPLPDIVIGENSPLQTITIANISPGPLENQALRLSVLSGNTSLINLNITNQNIGVVTTTTFSFKPELNQSGTATITVIVVDTDFSEFRETFQVQVMNINDPPTLNTISNLVILEDAALQTISLTGITAGPLETQVLTVTDSTDNPSLFEILSVSYTSSQSTATLKLKPKADANGTAQIKVTVKDDGSNVAPNSNNISRIFTLTVQPVNDLPVFVSTPTATATIGENYEYNVEVTDVDNTLASLVLTASSIPAWATFVNTASGKGKLSGTPPAGSFGKSTIVLQVKDPSGAPVTQQYDLTIDSRPVVSSFSLTTTEDTPIILSTQKFASSFTDADGSPLGEVQILALPNHGTLTVGGVTVNAGDKIPASALSTLSYLSNLDYYGKDTLRWNGSDGTLYAQTGSYIAFNITPINDPPVVSALETQPLKYDVGSGPQNITTTFEAVDVDNDSLASAEIGFRRENFIAGIDLLLFTTTTNITGKYDGQAGILTLSGKALKEEYTKVIRSIQYNLASTVNFTLENKSVYITLSDGKALSDTRDRTIDLIYTFTDLEIPSGFTPNGDVVNDTWEISHEKGIDQFSDAEVHVYNKRGLLVFESTGFEKKWDGVYKGELLPADSYFYTIDLKFPYIQKTYKGVVTILYSKN